MLEAKGYEIVTTNYKINSKGENIAEIDIIAEKDGEKYAVEVKSGKATLTSIRQVYANAKLAGFKPLLICKKSDEATKEAAKKLGVNIMEFSEYHLLLEPEELESIVKKCMEDVLEEHGFVPILKLDDEAKTILEAIAEARNFEHASKLLKIKEEELSLKISKLARKGILPPRSLSFKDLKRVAISILAKNELSIKLEEILKDIKEIKKKLGLI